LTEREPETAIAGTDRLGRPLTDPERAIFSALLRAHDFVGASIVALRFALKLTRRRQAAQDLQARANLRLVRRGWDPNKVSLVRCLCRLVWSEWTNELTESATARRATDVFLREQEVSGGHSVPSVEDQAARLETEREERERAVAQLEKLRARFVEAGDEVNLLWLEYTLQDVADPGEMARRSGRDVSEFYRAADRRKRQTRRLLAEKSGTKYEEDR
jgi:hypothetical protein